MCYHVAGIYRFGHWAGFRSHILHIIRQGKVNSEKTTSQKDFRQQVLFGIELLNLYDTRISAFVLDYHSLDLVQKMRS